MLSAYAGQVCQQCKRIRIAGSWVLRETAIDDPSKHPTANVGPRERARVRTGEPFRPDIRPVLTISQSRRDTEAVSRLLDAGGLRASSPGCRKFALPARTARVPRPPQPAPHCVNSTHKRRCYTMPADVITRTRKIVIGTLRLSHIDPSRTY
jgi:hypothetical protein